MTIKLTEEVIKSTEGEDDPVFNGIYIKTGCKCNGYLCSADCEDIRNGVKQQILENQEKAGYWDYLVQQPYYQEITKNGTDWYDELKRLRELVEEKITCNECINCDLLQSLLSKAKGLDKAKGDKE